MDGLSRLNRLAPDEARATLERCCGASRWVESMLRARPFLDEDRLYAAADAAFQCLGAEDWREAFAHHPRIGDKEALRARFASTSEWAAGEQAAALGAPEEVLDALARENRDFERRFGHIFIVCATGQSALEMLARLRERLSNDPITELRIAAVEQAKITRLRLAKLLASEAPS